MAAEEDFAAAVVVVAAEVEAGVDAEAAGRVVETDEAAGRAVTAGRGAVAGKGRA